MNLLQRLQSQTPSDAKKAQVILLFLTGFILKIATYKIIPITVTHDAWIACTVAAALCQFATKDAGIIGEIVSHPLSAIIEAPSIISQISEIHAAVAIAPATAPSAGELVQQAEQIIDPASGAPVPQPTPIIAPSLNTAPLA